MSVFSWTLIVLILFLIYSIYDLSKSNKALEELSDRMDILKDKIGELNSIEFVAGEKYFIVEPKQYSKILKKGENPFKPLKVFEIEVLDVKDGFVLYKIFDMDSEYQNMFTEMSADVLSLKKGVYYHSQYKKSKGVGLC